MVSVVFAGVTAVGVTLVGEKLQLEPAGKSEQVNETAELKPYCEVIVTPTVAPAAPGVTLMFEGSVETVKFGGAPFALITYMAVLVGLAAAYPFTMA